MEWNDVGAQEVDGHMKLITSLASFSVIHLSQKS